MNNALAAVAAIFLAVVGPASAQLCKDDNQDCCAYTATGDQGASSLNCDQLISESSVTWSGTASQSLVCRNDDAAASSRCSWITPAGKTCTFEKLGNQDVSEDCGDPAINFSGDLSGNTGLCQITVSTPSKEDHEGLWTCKYQNYRDTITVEVKKSGSGSGSGWSIHDRTFHSFRASKTVYVSKQFWVVC